MREIIKVEMNKFLKKIKEKTIWEINKFPKAQKDKKIKQIKTIEEN